MWKKGTPCVLLLVAVSIGEAIIENIVEVPQKLKREPPYDPEVPCRYKSKGDGNSIFKGTCNPMFSAALFTISKAWKQPKYLSIHEWKKTL